VSNLLGKREGRDNQQIEELWKIIKASITESAEKSFNTHKEIV